MKRALLVATILMFSCGMQAQGSSAVSHSGNTGKETVKIGVFTLKKQKQEQKTVSYYTGIQESPFKESKVEVVKVGNSYYAKIATEENGKIKLVRFSVKEKEATKKELKPIFEAVKEAEKNGYVLSEGKGKTLILFVDPYCPFCKKGLPAIYDKLVKKYKVVVVPFSVHGLASLKTTAYLLEKSKKEHKPFARELIREWNRYKGKEWYKELYKNTADKKTGETPLKTAEKLYQASVKIGIPGTPSGVVETQEGKFKLAVGPRKIKQVIGVE